MAGHEWEYKDWFEREEFIGQISDIRVQNLQGMWGNGGYHVKQNGTTAFIRLYVKSFALVGQIESGDPQ